MSDTRIAELRREIDALDDQLLAAANRRAALAREIGALKGGAPAYRPEREAEILRRMAGANPGPLPAEAVSGIFRVVISACRGMETTTRVAYLGPEGTFSEQAVRRQFGDSVEARALPSIDDVFRAAESGATQFAVVPVENSTEGAVGRSLDLLVVTPLRICGEIELRVHQNLMAKSADLSAIRRVYSHPQSLGQCAGWLNRNLPQAERVPASSNAEAARLASLEEGAAAIAGEMAAARFGLGILARSVEDDPNNTTRFLVVGMHDAGPSGRDKTSIVCASQNKAGAMYALLEPLARHGVSMSKFESRPSRTGLWEYVFYVDVEGHQSEEKVAKAFAELRDRAAFVKVLGSYPSAAA